MRLLPSAARVARRPRVLPLALVVVAAVAVLSLPASASAAPTLTYSGAFTFYVPGMYAPGESSAGEIGAPTGLAATTNGEVWVAAAVSRRTRGPYGDGADDTFVTARVIRRFAATGEILQTIEDPSTGGGHRSITDLAVSPDGQTLYAPALQSSGSGSRVSLGVLRIDAATGDVLGSFATPGSGPGNASLVKSVTAGPNGDLYAVVQGGGIKRYSSTGTFHGDVVLSDTTSPGKPALDPRNGDMLVTDADDDAGGIGGHIDRYSAAGAYLGRFGGPSAAAGQIYRDAAYRESALAIRPQDGAVYAASGEMKVSVFTAAGALVKRVGAPADSRYGFRRLAVDPGGARLWGVSDKSTAEVHHFAAGQDSTPDPAPLTPPDTTLDSGPSGATDDTTPTFAFSSSSAGATFECRVGDAPFTACTSPHTTGTLSAGSHTFAVRAVNGAGSDGSPATRSFTVTAPKDSQTTTNQTTQSNQPATTTPPPVPPAPLPPAVAAPVDTTAPSIPAAPARRTLTPSRTGVVAFAVGPVTEDSTGTVDLKSGSKLAVASAVARKRVLSLGRVSFVAAKGQTVNVKITLSRKNRALLRRLKRLPVVATITLRDAAGNTSSRVYRLTLGAPR